MRCRDCGREIPPVTAGPEDMVSCQACLRVASCEQNLEILSQELKRLTSALMPVMSALKNALESKGVKVF